MAYIECKIWPFSDDLIHQEERWEAMKAGHRHYTVKAMIDTSSSVNFISRSLADKLGRKYGNHYKKVKNSLGTIECLDLSFRYKGKDRLLAGSDKTFNDFEVTKKPCADLVLGLPWLWLHEAEFDIQREGIKIYSYFVPFCKYPNNDKSFYNSDSETELSELKRKVKKLERTVDWIGNYVEEQTALEPGKELTDSSDSDSFEPYYVSSDEPTSLEKKICKVKCVNKKSANKKAKPRRNQRKRARAKVEMESERQAERIPERPSEKDLSNNLPSDLEELTKVFEKNLEGLENLVKLFKSDVSKIPIPISPSSSINASPEK
ncbi:unnamed protein product [Rhizophagus irregularis]|nr:unnamed protein product [Rhizophagus irregularis]